MTTIEQGFQHSTIADITASRDGGMNPIGRASAQISGGLRVPKRKAHQVAARSANRTERLLVNLAQTAAVRQKGEPLIDG